MSVLEWVQQGGMKSTLRNMIALAYRPCRHLSFATIQVILYEK